MTTRTAAALVLDPVVQTVIVGFTVSLIGAGASYYFWKRGRPERYLLFWVAGWVLAAVRWAAHIPGEGSGAWRFAEVLLGSTFISLFFLGALDLVPHQRYTLQRAAIVLAFAFGVAIATGLAVDRLTGAVYLMAVPVLIATSFCFVVGYRRFRLDGFAIAAVVYFAAALAIALGLIFVGSDWRNSVISPLFNLFFVSAFVLIAVQRAWQSEKESEQKFASLADQAADAIFLCGPDGRFTDINETGVAMIGYSRQELLTIDLQSLVDPEELSRRPAQFEYLRTGKPLLSQRRLRRKDGSYFYGEISSRMIPGGKILGVVRDVTERKLAEDALKESFARYEALVHAALEGVMIHDKGVILDANPQFAQLFGYGSGWEMKGLVVPESLLTPESSKMIRALGEAGPVLEPVEVTGVRKDGTSFVAETQSGNSNYEGRAVRVVTMRDITARKRAEAELLRLNQELEARVAQRTQELKMANEELESFSYSVAHDLRAPLRAINAFSTMLADANATTLDQPSLAHLGRIKANSARMGRLIDDLLKLTQVSGQTLYRKQCDLSELANIVVNSLAQGDPARKVSVSVQPAMTVNADPGLLSVLLENLLGNAWKFTRRNEAATIDVLAVATDSGIAYVVRDNGAGFDMEHANKLFAPFQRLHNQNEFEGMGIGLSIVNRVVTKHGGKVWAESAPEQGAAFFFTFG